MAAQAEPAEEYQYASADYSSVWQVCVDESTGYTYYWNSSTNEVSWEPPVDYASLLQPPPPPPPPLPTGPDPALLAEQGIQLITSYGGDSTDSDSEDDGPARPSRPVAPVRSPSPVPEYGPSLPPPEEETGPAAPSPIAEFGPQLPPACDETGSEPASEGEEVAPLSMGPYGTTSAAFVGPLMPPEVTSSPDLTADNDGEDTADSEEEALLAQLRERAAQLKQLGGELPSGVEATIEAEAGGEPRAASEGADEETGRRHRKRKRHSRSKSPLSEVGGPPAKGKHRQPRPRRKSDRDGDCVDAPVPAVNDDPMLDIISAIENERPPDYEPAEGSTEPEVASGARVADDKGEVKDLSVKSPPVADGDVPSADSDPADDILSAIEREVPPDHQETSLASVTERRDSRDSPSAEETRVERIEPVAAEADTTLDIFSAIENEIPPDYAEASLESRTEETPMEIASDSEEKQESSAEQDAQSADTAPSSKKQKSHPKPKDVVTGSDGGSTALASSEPMDIISEIENELPPDYAEPTSQSPDKAEPETSSGVAEPDKSGSTPTGQSSPRRESGSADPEPSEAKPASATAAQAKTTEKKPDTESPPKRARRRSRSVQGMGLIASYGSDSDSDSDSDSQEVSQVLADRVTDSDRARVRGDTPTPLLPGDGRVDTGSTAVTETDGSPAQPPGTADSAASTNDTQVTSETPASTGPERASRPDRTRPRKKRTSAADTTTAPAETAASTASAETADAAACYTTFSAGAYEAPVMAAQDGTRVGFGFHDNGAAERMAWEKDSDAAQKSTSSDGGSRLKFVQFQKGATLKPPQPAAAQADAAASGASAPERPARRESPPTDETQSRYDSHEDEAAIRDLVSEIVDKLEFLGVASETVTPLKVFAVQTQTLLDAWTEGALKPAYFRRWLNGQAAVFAARERESAPPGWTMHWNRKLKRYSYTNQKTRLIMYTFPETADEADIPQPQPKKLLVPAAEKSEVPAVAQAPAPAAQKAPKECQPPTASKPSPPPAAPAQPAPKPETPPPPPPSEVSGALPAPPPPPSLPPTLQQPAPPPPPTLRPTKRRVPPPPVLSAYEPLPPGVDAPPPEEEVSEPVPPPPPPPQISAPEPPPPPPPASELLSELDSFYSEVGMLDEMSKPAEPAPPPPEPAPPAPPAAAPAPEAASHTHRKKKKAKLNSALVHKKKGVDKLVAKWKTVQKELR